MLLTLWLTLEQRAMLKVDKVDGRGCSQQYCTKPFPGADCNMNSPACGPVIRAKSQWAAVLQGPAAESPASCCFHRNAAAPEIGTMVMPAMASNALSSFEAHVRLCLMVWPPPQERSQSCHSDLGVQKGDLPWHNSQVADHTLREQFVADFGVDP